MATFKETAKLALASRPFQIVVSLIIVVAIIYFIGRSAGKKAASGTQVPYPGSPEDDGLSKVWIQQQAPAIVEGCHKAFDGYSINFEQKAGQVKSLINLTDNQLTYIYNAYNKLYQPAKKETLYTVIESETILGFDGEPRKALLVRMRALGLR